MAFAPISVKDTDLLGFFIETEFRNHFEFSKAGEGETVPFSEFPVKVWIGGLGNDNFRWAKVLKTRAFVVVDEAADGSPVVEKWLTRNTRFWNK